MSAPYTIAAIDAGSNAIRVQVSAIVGDELVPLESERVPVRLGRNAFTVGELTPATIDAAVAAFARFKKLFDYHNVQHYRAVATSATRTVRNREHLLHSIHYETGIDVEVIDGGEEIRLVRQAVSHAMEARRAPDILMDLGGGSIEIGRTDNGKWRSVSLPIGTVRMMESFDLQGAITDDDEKLLTRYVQNMFARHDVRAFGRPDEKAVVATGGNAEALCKLFGKEDKGVYRLPRKALDDGLRRLLPMPMEARCALWGMREDRAEVIGIAGVIFREAMAMVGATEMQAPCVGVREGILLDLFQELREEQGGVTKHAALLGAFRVYMGRLGHEVSHGEHVRRLALQLFDGLRDVHRLPDVARSVLEYASLAHDVGEVVDRKAHHHHSEYLIMHGRIPGLDSPMREMVAALSRAHRKSMPDALKHPVYARLKPEQRVIVDKLVPLIRIADALDTDHRHQVRKVSVRRASDHFVLEVDCAGQDLVSAESFGRRNAYFEKAFGIPLHTEIVSGRTASHT